MHYVILRETDRTEHVFMNTLATTTKNTHTKCAKNERKK